ncbi:MAG TPA: methionyl-tRNA formyltransferase, partial [Polyangiales bacterium]
LAALGSRLIREQLPRAIAGELSAIAQDHARATLAPLLHREDGAIDWRKDARAIHDLARGFAPWPSAYTFLDEQRLKLHRTDVLDEQAQVARPGEILRGRADAIVVGCGRGLLALREVQLDGGRKLTAAEFSAGHRLAEGARFR